jgi:LSD1 subclass zinc finger protein
MIWRGARGFKMNSPPEPVGGSAEVLRGFKWTTPAACRTPYLFLPAGAGRGRCSECSHIYNDYIFPHITGAAPRAGCTWELQHVLRLSKMHTRSSRHVMIHPRCRPGAARPLLSGSEC